MDSTSAVVSSRKCRKTSYRISNLSLNITERILECLPLQEAVKTSVLSSHWKYKWASISQIVLDKQFCTSFEKAGLETADVSLAYSKAVNDILFSHVGPLRKLVLYLPLWFPEEADISQWIRYAHANGVKEFTLVNDLDREGKLPSCMFSCVGLTDLTLLELKSCPLLSLPPTFGGFPYLTSLKLEARASGSPCIKTDVLEMLISKCPKLQSLYLEIYELYDLTICAPKLNDLSVKGMLPELRLEGTSVNTLALGIMLLKCSCAPHCLSRSECSSRRRYISDIFNCSANVEKIVLEEFFWMGIQFYKLSVEIPNKLERLQTLKLVELPLHCQYSISFVLCLFASCPLLEQLCIEVSEKKEVQENGLSAQLFDGNINLQCLRNVQLLRISGSKSELQLVKFLLANSVVL